MTSKHYIKITVIGDSNTGKSSLIKRVATNKFTENTQATIGSDLHSYELQRDKSIFSFNLWDTAGQQRYRSLLPMYIKNSKAIFIVYDITEEKTFETAKYIYIDNVIKVSDENSIVILIGNKSDLKDKRKILKKEAAEFAKHYNIHFIEISAKNSTNILKLFNIIIDNIKLDDSDHDEIINVIDDIKSVHRCCIIS